MNKTLQITPKILKRNFWLIKLLRNVNIKLLKLNNTNDCLKFKNQLIMKWKEKVFFGHFTVQSSSEIIFVSISLSSFFVIFSPQVLSSFFLPPLTSSSTDLPFTFSRHHHTFYSSISSSPPHCYVLYMSCLLFCLSLHKAGSYSGQFSTISELQPGFTETKNCFYSSQIIMMKVFSGHSLTCHPAEYLSEGGCCPRCPAGKI